MEALGVLEKKIADLVELVAKMRAENVRLFDENLLLKKRIESLENLSLTHENESEREREVTKVMVDSLIRDIDAVIEQEHSQ
jgi:regulator of replication initiation timing